MINNKTIELSPKIENAVYSVFQSLPLKSKLVIYAKFVHGNSFKAQNNDLFGLNKRAISKIYREFIEEVRERLC